LRNFSQIHNHGNYIGESHDVASEHPDLVRKLAEIMKREHTPRPVFPMRPID